MNIGVGSIITKGLGGPAENLLIFGPFHLYIEPLSVTPTPTATQTLTPTPTPSSVTPTPTPTSGVTPTPTPSVTPSGNVGGGAGGSMPPGGMVVPRDDEDYADRKYKLTFVVKFRNKKIKRSFIVDSFKKDKIIKTVSRINTLRVKFKVAWNKVKNNRFFTKWKR